ncbi:MAG TPA: zinc ribbon domain-containing protein [Candidatus Competibacter sp.]|nr:zinc ribbon domain-containing protein [Candidatus Competibacter sp.]
MPIYEYRCQSCNHALEVMQKLSDPELSDCPACGQPELKKLISVVGFRLKGGGWYETDFKGGDKKKNVVKDDSPSASETKSAPACDGAGGCGTCATPAATTT